MKTNTTSERETQTKQSTADLVGTALRNYEQVMRANLKLQEEAGKAWTSMLTKTASGQDWQKNVTHLTGMANHWVPEAQRRMQEIMALMEKSGQTSADLMKKAVDAAQAPAVAESQAKWMEFWTSSMNAMRPNTETMGEITYRAIDSWIEIMRKNGPTNR